MILKDNNENVGLQSRSMRKKQIMQFEYLS
jgi:hypothetical protein